MTDRPKKKTPGARNPDRKNGKAPKKHPKDPDAKKREITQEELDARAKRRTAYLKVKGKKADEDRQRTHEALLRKQEAEAEEAAKEAEKKARRERRQAAKAERRLNEKNLDKASKLHKSLRGG